MVKRFVKRTLFWTLVFYLLGMVGVGYGYSVQVPASYKPALTMEGFQAGLSWPWLVAQAVIDHS